MVSACNSRLASGRPKPANPAPASRRQWVETAAPKQTTAPIRIPYNTPMSEPIVSVILCTRNPRAGVFAGVLSALATQTLPHDRWEAIVVDNGSEPPVAIPADVKQPGRLWVVGEPTPGLTAARLRGLREARGDLVVFVDDDNLLDADYLAEAVRLADAWPHVGVFGGRISPEFEADPPEWLEPFYSHLALTTFDRDEWSNLGDDRGVIPCGAGLCIRRSCAEAWAATVAADERRLALGRRDTQMLSCEDTDMVLTCLDEGWGSARFTALHLTHVIPASRLDYAYHRRLARDIGYSYGRLLALRGRSSRGRRMIALGKTVLAFLGVKHRGRARKLDVAYHYGYWRGLRSV
jgi:glycosyltransferase involved in cell wall biosynthesis